MSVVALAVLLSVAASICVASDIPPPIVFNVSNYSQLEQLAHAAHDLKNWSGGKAMVTLTDNASAANQTLCKPTCRVPLLILETGTPWPGNLYKIMAFRAAALALPAKTVVFFTDCCDVMFLSSPADVFDAFSNSVVTDSSHLAGAEVVIGVERGYSTILREGNETIKLHDHYPNELPDNAMEAAAGVLNICDDKWKMCSHSKIPNSGSIIGYARSLANMYDGACNMDSQCIEWERTHGNVSLNITSDQNVLTHYLLGSNFSDGRIALDHDMALFHVTVGFTPADYDYRDGHLVVDLPWSRGEAVINASVVHVPNLGSPQSADVMKRMEGLDPSLSIMSKLQELVGSSTPSKRKHRFLAGSRSLHP